MKKLIILAFLAVFTLYSCHRPMIGKTITLKDSTVTSIVYRDTIINVPGAQDTLWLKNPCDSITGKLKPVAELSKHKSASISVISKGQDIELVANCDTYKIQLDSAMKTINTLKNHSLVSVQTIQVKYVPKIYVFSLFFTIFAILGIVAFILFKLKII